MIISTVHGCSLKLLLPCIITFLWTNKVSWSEDCERFTKKNGSNKNPYRNASPPFPARSGWNRLIGFARFDPLHATTSAQQRCAAAARRHLWFPNGEMQLDFRWTHFKSRTNSFVNISSVKKKKNNIVKLHLQDAVETTRRESRDCPHCGDGLPEEKISPQALCTCAYSYACKSRHKVGALFACKMENVQPCMWSVRLPSDLSCACKCAAVES